jgi:hypothetical protein
MLKILALQYISLSEIQKIRPEINDEWINKNPVDFKDILFGLGLDIHTPYETQLNIPHRNRFNEEVRCTRVVGNERIDSEWCASNYASRDAVMKASGNRLITDLYRMKGCVE